MRTLNNVSTWSQSLININCYKTFCVTEPIEKVMIFANRRDQVRKLYDNLKRDGYKAVMLSGEIAQDKRLKMLDQLKMVNITP